MVLSMTMGFTALILGATLKVKGLLQATPETRATMLPQMHHLAVRSSTSC